MRALRLALAGIAIIVIVAFSLSNRQAVSVDLWPSDLTLDAPLSLVVLAASAVFFLGGALIGAGGAAAARRRAHRAEARLQVLEARQPLTPVDSFGRPLPTLAQYEA